MMNESEVCTHEIPALLSPRETAAALRLTVQTLRKWRRRGQGPDYVVISHRVRYPVASVHKWLQQRMRAVEQ